MRPRPADRPVADRSRRPIPVHKVEPERCRNRRSGWLAPRLRRGHKDHPPPDNWRSIRSNSGSCSASVRPVAGRHRLWLAWVCGGRVLRFTTGALYGCCEYGGDNRQPSAPAPVPQDEIAAIFVHRFFSRVRRSRSASRTSLESIVALTLTVHHARRHARRPNDIGGHGSA